MADISEPIISPPEVERPGEAQLKIDDGLAKHLAEDTVSISLKYYRRSCECWSDWQAKELKEFSKTVEKLRKYTVRQLTSRGGPHYDTHKGPPKGGGFSRPEEVSKDIQFCEIGVSGKSRMHGFILGTVFFLVWLDRGHRVFPAGK